MDLDVRCSQKAVKLNHSLTSKWQYSSIDSDNGMVAIRRQAIIWTNDGLLTHLCVIRPQRVGPTGVTRISGKIR